MLTVHQLPELRQPAVLCALSGWSDAGSGASGALAYLLGKWSARRFAEFDSDAIYNYAVTRPTTLRPGGRRRLHWPDLAWYAMPVPHAQRDLVLLLGPEPDLRWRELCRAAAELVERLQGSMFLSFGSFLAQVSHTTRVPLFGRSNDAELAAGLAALNISDTDYQGPTGLVTALGAAVEARGLPAAGLWAAAPIYLQGTANPCLSAALLRAAQHLLRTDLGIEELETSARDFRLRLNDALRDRPDFQRLLQSLGGQLEPEEAGTLAGEAEPSPPAELPTSEEVLRDLENYLRELRGQADEPES